MIRSFSPSPSAPSPCLGRCFLPEANVVLKTSPGLVPYEESLSWMEHRVEALARGEASEAVWLLEHPPLYTAGTSARSEDLLDPLRFPVFEAGRGGQYTYHGPGQRVAYVLLNLGARGHDVRAYVWNLEHWLIGALGELGIDAQRREGRVGLWVRRVRGGQEREEKIAAIGVRLRRWVSFHGIALNVFPDLSHFSGIVPCGLGEYGVTSLHDLGVCVDLKTVDAVLLSHFEKVFGSYPREAP